MFRSWTPRDRPGRRGRFSARSGREQASGNCGRSLRTKPNPRGQGTFVYHPTTRFVGVERHLLWLVLDGKAYALNGASKDITPTLPWPREAEDTVWSPDWPGKILGHGSDRVGFHGGNEMIAAIYARKSPSRTASPTSRSPSRARSTTRARTPAQGLDGRRRVTSTSTTGSAAPSSPTGPASCG